MPCHPNKHRHRQKNEKEKWKIESKEGVSWRKSWWKATWDLQHVLARGVREADVLEDDLATQRGGQDEALVQIDRGLAVQQREDVLARFLCQRSTYHTE
jgi:hypothetical protein